jgi:hypothetical protein
MSAPEESSPLICWLEPRRSSVESLVAEVLLMMTLPLLAPWGDHVDCARLKRAVADRGVATPVVRRVGDDDRPLPPPVLPNSRLKFPLICPEIVPPVAALRPVMRASPLRVTVPLMLEPLFAMRIAP